jgi:hypothetical protein
MNKQKHIITMVLIIIVITGGAFYGGMQYGARNIQTKISSQQEQGRGFGNQRGPGQGGGQRGAMMGPNGGAGDFSGGEITAKDDTSITIKSRNGSSQIIFFSTSTTIGKAVEGTNADLNVGQQITANGKANPDGSLVAQNIQIKPEQSKDKTESTQK